MVAPGNRLERRDLSDHNSLEGMMDAPNPETIDLLRRLVAFDTTSRNSNLALIDFARELLESNGAYCLTVPSPDRRKANLYATIGPLDRGGVLLSGHSDVVPVDGQDWRTDPFELVESEGRYYGRGACDMKGFLAVVLAAVPELAAAELAEPLHIAITYDEEVGCQGVPVLIEAMQTMPHRPRFCIVGEPTEMHVAIGHKGSRSFQACFHGRGGHSSLAPLSVNAVEHAAELVTRLSALGRRYADEGPFDPDFDVAHTTVHTGVIRGGTQVNIVPALCELDFEYRALPQHDDEAPESLIRSWLQEEIVPAMRQLDERCGVDLVRRSAYPGLATDREADITQLARELSPSGEPIKVAFGTEAGSYQKALGIPSVVCGPGSIRQAHQPNEYIAASQLRRAEEFMVRLSRKLMA